MMKASAAKDPPKRKGAHSLQKQDQPGSENAPVHCQPVSPCDDLHVRIAQRAYALHAERGYREGRALDDWLEAEREILVHACNA